MMKKSMTFPENGSIVDLNSKIQLLRGLAIIAVVFIHNMPIGIMQVIGRPFVNFSVGMFLFLSGMLSSKAKWNPKKRIVKVIIPYLLWTLLYVICKNYENPMTLPILYIKSLLTGNAAAVMYYIFVYCEFTLLIPLVDKLARSKWKWMGFVISPVEIVAVRYLPLFMGWEINQYAQIIIQLSCVGWFTYFYLGYLFGNKIITLKYKNGNLIVVCIFSIVLQMLEGYLQYMMGNDNCGTQLKLSAIFSGVLLCMLAYSFIYSQKKKRCIYLEKFGNCSFGIFFCHLLIQMVLVKVIPIYKEYIIFPLNAILVMHISLLLCVLGKKVLGKYAKYLGL